MKAEHPLHGKLSLVLLSSALLLVIGGCSLGASTPVGGGRTTARVGATDTATAIPSLTAAEVPSPTVPAYLLPSAPLLPARWSWYRDSTAHFQVPLAPGWRAGGYYGTAGKTNCFYSELGDLLLGCERDGVAQGLQSPQGLAFHPFLIQGGKVRSSQLSVGLLLCQDVIDNDEQAMGNGHGRFVVSPSCEPTGDTVPRDTSP